MKIINEDMTDDIYDVIQLHFNTVERGKVAYGFNIAVRQHNRTDVEANV